MKIELDTIERKMLLEAARSLKQADRDSIGHNYTNAAGELITAATIRRWNVIIIKKLRGKP